MPTFQATTHPDVLTYKLRNAPWAMWKQYITQGTCSIHKLGSCWPITPCGCTCSKSDAARYLGICWSRTHMVHPRIWYTLESIHNIHRYCIYALCKAHDIRFMLQDAGAGLACARVCVCLPEAAELAHDRSTQGTPSQLCWVQAYSRWRPSG